MNFLDKLERKYNKYAIKNLMFYIMSANALVFLLSYLVSPGIVGLLSFNINAILQGQVWRIVTFIFVPQHDNILWFAIFAFMYYYIGRELEYTWGVFKFNIYYFLGMFLTILASALFKIPGTPYYINLSLFLAYATLFPDLQFRLYFFIPVKAKYLAIIYVIVLLREFLFGLFAIKMLIIISLLNYLLFFGIPLLNKRRTPTQRQFIKQKREFKKGSNSPIHVAFHKCHTCGKTEHSDPDMEFRYCSKCSGNYEYCMQHIKDHDHVE